MREEMREKTEKTMDRGERERERVSVKEKERQRERERRRVLTDMRALLNVPSSMK